MNKLLVALLAAFTIYFGIAAYGSYRSKTVNTEEPVMIYAGDPIEVKNEIMPPSLYSCVAPDKDIVHLVISVDGEFMMFDGNGVWVTNGTFFRAETDKGVKYWHAEVGSNLMGFFQTPNGWKLAISTEKGVTELKCK